MDGMWLRVRVFVSKLWGDDSLREIANLGVLFFILWLFILAVLLWCEAESKTDPAWSAQS